MSEEIFTSDMIAKARTVRRANLVKKWKDSVRLTEEERGEILDLIEPPAPPKPEIFNLRTAEQRKVTSYVQPYRAYVTVYGLQEPHGIRTIKRWVKAGKESSPPELPPLDQKEHMAAWWRRVRPESPPPRILLDYEKETPPASKTEDRRPEIEDRTPNSETRSPAASISSIEFDAMIMGEGESVRQARQAAKANFQRLSDASKGNDGKGDSDDYRRWFPIWKESLHLLNQLEREDRAARKAGGDLLPKAQIMAEVVQLLEALRLMRGAAPQKVIAELSKNASGKLRRVLQLIEAPLTEAIIVVLARDSDVFQNIESLGSAAEAEEKFKLVAA